MFPEIRGAAIPIGAGDMADLMAATNAAGEAAFQDPHPFEGDLDELLVQIDFSTFTNEELMALDAPGPETDAHTACSAARRLYEQALALPEPDRSQLLRGMFSSVQ